MIVRVVKLTPYGVQVERLGGGALTACLLPGFRPSPGDWGWLEGNTLYALPGKSAWRALYQSLNPRYLFLLVLHPGDAYTLEDGTLGVAGPDGAVILVPPDVPINNGPPRPGQVTVPDNVVPIELEQNVVYNVYSRDNKIIFLDPDTHNLLGV